MDRRKQDEKELMKAKMLQAQDDLVSSMEARMKKFTKYFPSSEADSVSNSSANTGSRQPHSASSRPAAVAGVSSRSVNSGKDTSGANDQYNSLIDKYRSKQSGVGNK